MTERIRNSSLSQRLFYGALVLIFITVSVQYSVKVSKGKSALIRWAEQIKQMEGGEDIHKKYNYPNPPIMALLLTPLAELVAVNAILGALTWFYVKVALAILCMLWVFRLVESPGNPFPAWAKALTVALSIRPILGDLSHGNINIFILFLVVASLVAFSRGRDVLSGVLLALAIACKVTPALFVGYFLWKGAWRVLLGTALGLALFFLFVPALFLGWEANLHALKSWIEVMIVPFLVDGVVTPEHNNQSLPGLIARMLTAAPSFSTYIGDVYAPLRYDNIADIGPAGAKLIVKAFMALFALLVIWKCRTPISRPGQATSEARQGWRLAAEYSLIIVGMLLFSERTWKHHCVTLLLPFAVLCHGISTPAIGRGRKRFLVAALIVVTLLMSTTSTGLVGESLNRLQDQAEATSMILGPAGLAAATQAGIYTDSNAKLAQVYGAYVWGFFLFIAGLAVMLRRDERQVAAAIALPPREARRLAG
jgi:alpha-1,2-mannosyltransferase